jgi:GTP-binding protein
MSKPGSCSVSNITSAALAVVAPKPSLFPADGFPQVAFAGRSNVGKSSLINALANRKKLAYTSDTPGKTREVHFFLMNELFYFVDLPGYGYARLSLKERAWFKVLVEKYFVGTQPLRGCVLLLDPRRPVGEEELAMLQFLRSRSIPTVAVFTKWDRVRPSQRFGLLKSRQAEFAGAAGRTICCSARTKEGLDALRSVIDSFLQAA